MYHPVNVILSEDRHDGIKITDISLDEGIVRLIGYIGEVVQVPRVCELIDIDDMIVGVLVHEQLYDMCADESRSSCDDDIPHNVFFIQFVNDSFQ